jgi:hypothetical protein
VAFQGFLTRDAANLHYALRNLERDAVLGKMK